MLIPKHGLKKIERGIMQGVSIIITAIEKNDWLMGKRNRNAHAKIPFIMASVVVLISSMSPKTSTQKITVVAIAAEPFIIPCVGIIGMIPILAMGFGFAKSVMQ